MQKRVREMLIEAADRYETAAFIENDPIQFPHRYSGKADIEISAFISAWMAYGSRKVFLPILDGLHTIMDRTGGPSAFIKQCGGEYSYGHDPDSCLYRFYKWKDYDSLCSRLSLLYSSADSMEQLFEDGTPLNDNVKRLCDFFSGVNGVAVSGSTSANKRLYMFLRWMVRTGSPVDFGLWNRICRRDLIIPLDTHVYQEALRFGLTSRKGADLKTAVEITSCMAEIWPEDPARGDFALYGTGIDCNEGGFPSEK